MSTYRHLFGPVHSRRLGLSLGIDLVPWKTCSFDCVFCQAGRTTVHTLDRRAYVPIAEIAQEFGRWQTEDGRADHITLAGSGEPTLHTRFGDVLDMVRGCCRIPTVLMTNSSLFSLPEVRAAACRADTVKASLSAWDQASFEQVNRPPPELGFARVLGGLRDFRNAYAGRLWIEVFLVDGVNDRPADVVRIATLVQSLHPECVHLNTVVRPPAEADAHAVPAARLQALAALFTPAGEVVASPPLHEQVQATARADEPAGASAMSDEALLSLIRRHPCSLPQLAEAAGSPVDAMEARMARLVSSGVARAEVIGGVRWYATR